MAVYRQVIIGDRTGRNGCAQGDQRAAAGDGQGVGFIASSMVSPTMPTENLHRSLPGRELCIRARTASDSRRHCQ
jgi:hypothetical protein